MWAIFSTNNKVADGNDEKVAQNAIYKVAGGVRISDAYEGNFMCFSPILSYFTLQKWLKKPLQTIVKLNYISLPESY